MFSFLEHNFIIFLLVGIFFIFLAVLNMLLNGNEDDSMKSLIFFNFLFGTGYIISMISFTIGAICALVHYLQHT